MSLLLLFFVQYSMYKMVDRGVKSQEARNEETTLLNKGKNSTSDDSKRCKIKFPFCVWEEEIEARKCVSCFTMVILAAAIVSTQFFDVPETNSNDNNPINMFRVLYCCCIILKFYIEMCSIFMNWSEFNS